jgi:hypothetical protein
MAKFQRKPPVIDALQFTGGTANAKTIVEGVATLAPTYTLRYIPAGSEYGLQGGVVAEFKNTERLRVENMADGVLKFASVGDWVIATRNGEVEVLTNADFTAQYQPA